MNSEEWEILEVADAFYFTFSLVPIQWHNSQPKPVRTARDEHIHATQTWWQTHQPTISIRDYCDGCLIRCDGSPWEFNLTETVWTDDNHHRVELWEKQDNVVADLHIKIDARYPYVDFLAWGVKFADRLECLFHLDHEDEFVDATSSTIFEALIRSPAVALANRRFEVPNTDG